jgi:iron complex outermembrane recepter protein
VTFAHVRRGLCAGLATSALFWGAAAAQTPASRTLFEIEAGPLHQALLAYADQADRQLLFDPKLTAGKTAPTVRGALSPDEALGRLIGGSGLVASERRPGVIVLKSAAAAWWPASAAPASSS